MKTPANVLSSRQDRLLRSALEIGLDGYLIYANGSALGAGTASHGHMRYLTDWDSHEASSMFLCLEDRKHLYVGSAFLMPLARMRKIAPVIEFARPTEYSAFVASALITLQDPRRRLGIVGLNEMPVPVLEALRKALPTTTFVDLTDVIDNQRVVIDEAQLNGHKAAAKACDAMFAVVREVIASGKKVFQMQTMLEAIGKDAGAEYCKTWMTIRSCADYPRYWNEECDTFVEPGDQALVGIMLRLDGHWGHGIRMGSIGTPTVKHRALFDVVKKMQDSGLNALAEKADLARVEGAMHEALRDHYADDQIAKMTRFRYGHGLGYSYEEALTTSSFPQHFEPSPITSERLNRYQPGTLLELHPNYFIPGEGGVALGDMVYLTEIGPELLLESPRQLNHW